MSKLKYTSKKWLLKNFEEKNWFFNAVENLMKTSAILYHV